MRIASLNIGEDERNSDGHLTMDSYSEIVNQINEQKIDIICLQEAIITSKTLPKISEYISNNTDLKYIVEYELSDSHINADSKMGILVCSKYKIDNVEKVLLDNPNIIYKISEDITYYSHDKGFIICDINNIKVITGHCLPFHVFKKNPLDYLYIFDKFDNKLMNQYFMNNRIVLCGDINYDDVNKLFPKFMVNSKDFINKSTQKDKQLDHILVTNNIKVIYNDVINSCFDHKLCIVEII